MCLQLSTARHTQHHTWKVSLQKLLHERSVCLILKHPDLLVRMPERLRHNLLVQVDQRLVEGREDCKAPGVELLDSDMYCCIILQDTMAVSE